MVIHGRSDATLNAGGVRIGTAEIYRQVEQLPEVVESLAIGQEWDDDTRIVLFVRLSDPAGPLSDELAAADPRPTAQRMLPPSRPGADRRGAGSAPYPVGETGGTRGGRCSPRQAGAQHGRLGQPGVAGNVPGPAAAAALNRRRCWLDGGACSTALLARRRCWLDGALDRRRRWIDGGAARRHGWLADTAESTAPSRTTHPEVRMRVGRRGLEPRTRGLRVRCSAS